MYLPSVSLLALDIQQLYASIAACFEGNEITTDSFPPLPSTIWGSESFITKDPPTDLSHGLNSWTYSLKAAGFLTVVVNSQKPEALTAVGKAKAAKKGINNLRIKKDGFIPLC